VLTAYPTVETVHHVDGDNMPLGVRCIFIFGESDDWSQQPKLVLELGEECIASDLLPCVPFYLPSAIIPHFNFTIGPTDGYRGSLVF
jgi:hypothetical protein